VDRYVIRGGEEGYERLQLLARERWPETRALFERVGLGPGMRCIDLGCGGGEVTLQMARLVAPDGAVVGVDADEIKLAHAREKAAERGVQNVEFRVLNVNEWNEPDGYDAVFCRFLLQHLRGPIGMLRRMWAGVREGGVIIVEDADFDGWCCYPANEGFDYFLRRYSHAIARWGGDHATGRKLYSYFQEGGIPLPRVSANQPAYIDGDGKALAWSTLRASKESILEAGGTSEEEFDEALQSLDEFTRDPGSLISGPRIFQLWSKR